MNTTLGVCAHCHRRHPTTKLYRLIGVGIRPLCQPCHDSLDRLGMNIQKAA